jgi:nicotinate phosphoribosyltransferase
MIEERGIKIRGIRIDSGDLVALSRFAREYFQKEGLDFMKIFVSGDLDEYRIGDLLAQGTQIDGIGIGTRYGAARHAPAVEIVYKLVQYDGKGLLKTAPDKHTRPGRKSLTRSKRNPYEKDIVTPFDPEANDLLRPFTSAEPMATIQKRLRTELAALPPGVKAIRDPSTYPVEFLGYGDARSVS